jgi:hypothetical protein
MYLLPRRLKRYHAIFTLMIAFNPIYKTPIPENNISLLKISLINVF